MTTRRSSAARGAPPGRAWQDVDISPRQSGAYTSTPSLGIDARGNAVAVWILTLPIPPNVDPERERPAILQGAVRPAGGTCQSRSLPAAEDVEQATNVAGPDPSGNPVAVWLRRSPSGLTVAGTNGP